MFGNLWSFRKGLLGTFETFNQKVGRNDILPK